MNTFIKFIASIIILGVAGIGILAAVAVLPDWTYKGTSELTEEQYIKLINDEDIGNELKILEIRDDNIYFVEYNFEKDGKIDLLDRKTNKTTEFMIYIVIGAGVIFVPMIIWLVVWNSDRYIKKEND